MKINKNTLIGDTGISFDDVVGKVLWTNPNGYSHQEFLSQTISFGNNYKYYDVIFAQDGVQIWTQRFYVEPSAEQLVNCVCGGFCRTRKLVANLNSIYFGEGLFYSQYGSGTVNNYQCIPYQIIGYSPVSR